MLFWVQWALIVVSVCAVILLVWDTYHWLRKLNFKAYVVSYRKAGALRTHTIEAQSETAGYFLVADEGASFLGAELKARLAACHVHYGQGDVFHFYLPGEDEPGFSVALATPPGHFEHAHLEQRRYGALVFYCHFSHTALPEHCFEKMKSCLLYVQAHLGGCILDEDKKQVRWPMPSGCTGDV